MSEQGGTVLQSATGEMHASIGLSAEETQISIRAHQHNGRELVHLEFQSAHSCGAWVYIRFRDRAHMAQIARGMLGFAEPEALGEATLLRAVFARLRERVQYDRDRTAQNDAAAGFANSRVANALDDVLSQIDYALENVNDCTSPASLSAVGEASNG